MKIGIYVGSFNPPHLGHLEVAKYALENHYVDMVYFLPTPSYWDKNNLVSVEDRVQMLKYYENQNIKVDSIHNQYPYTYQILEHVHKDFPQDEIYLMIGSDQLNKLHMWENIDDILKDKILVFKRGDYVPNPKLQKYEEQFIYLNDFLSIPISSTEIRNGSSQYIHPSVLQYIKKHHFYQNNNNE